MSAQHDSYAEFSQLIRLIYATAADDSQWPALVCAVAQHVGQGDEGEMDAKAGNPDTRTAPQNGTFPQASAQQVLLLRRHFEQAAQLRQQLHSVSAQLHAAQTVVQSLPIGVAVVDAAGFLVLCNDWLERLLQGQADIAVSDGRLVSYPPTLFREALNTALSTAQGAALRLDGGRKRLDLWIEKKAQQPADAGHAIVWVTSPDDARAIPASSLRILYGLTLAESKLAQKITSGVSLEEAASQLGIGMSTARTQLRGVFSKIGACRQGALVYAVHRSAIGLQREPADAAATQGVPGAQRQGARHSGMRLRDGRWLAWADLGPPDGTPAIFHHIVAGCRTLHRPELHVLYESGLRLIMPERPGVGDSDPQPHRTVAHWCDDLRALADHLGLPRFAVIGFSEGTAYALAAACALGNRVRRTILVGASAPADLHSKPRDTGRIPFNMMLLLARHAPVLVTPLLRLVIRRVHGSADRFFDELKRSIPEPDRRVFEDPIVRAGYVRGLLSSAAHGEDGLLCELLLAAQGWELAEAKHLPGVQFFHGQHDWLFDISSLQRAAAQFPGSTVHEISGGGHLLMWTHWEAIVPRIARIIQMDDDSRQSFTENG